MAAALENKAKEGAKANTLIANAKTKISMGGISDKLSSMWESSQRNMVIVTIFAAITAAVLVLILWTSTERYRPLYSVSSKYDSSQVLQMLDSEGFKYTLRSDDGQILVPEKNVAQIRMVLAAKGLKEQLPNGFDSLDGNSSLGESQFMENARYRHALEGELARSITTMDQISLARVHLAIPKETLFVREDAEKPRASVIVNLIHGTDLKQSQVTSIINLVSGSVIGLRPENISVVDQYGRLLSEDADEKEMSMASGKQADYKRKLERKLISQAADMLTPILGAQNFRVQVESDIDFSKRQETEENYTNPVVRRESLKSDNSDSTLALGIPGALSNTPPVTDGEEIPNPNTTKQRSEENRDFAVSGKVTHTEYQQGVVQSLSVSVVINDQANLNGTWTEQELNRVQNIVMAAVGFKAERGDTVHITNFPFVVADLSPQTDVKWYSNPDIMQPVKYLLGALLAFMMIIFVLRPLVKFLTEDSSPVEDLEGHLLGVNSDGAEEESDTETKALEGKADSGNGALGLDSSGIHTFENELPSPDSSLEVQISHLQMIASKDPERVSEILRGWMEKKPEEDSNV